MPGLRVTGTEDGILRVYPLSDSKKSDSSDNIMVAKSISRRLIWLAAVCVMLVFLASCGNKEPLPPRDIVIEELHGTVQVCKAGEEWEAYQGLTLVSGDEVHVGGDSDVTLAVDAGRHLYADAGTVFSLEAEGKPGKGRITVHLEEGAAVAGLDGKVKKKDPFTLVTPHMTAEPVSKGTVFTVEIATDGSDATDVLVNKGSVEVTTVLGGSARTQVLAEGERGAFAGSAPAIAESGGQTTTETGGEIVTDGNTSESVDGKSVSDGGSVEMTVAEEETAADENVSESVKEAASDAETSESAEEVDWPQTNKEAQWHNFKNVLIQIGRIAVFVIVALFLIKFFRD